MAAGVAGQWNQENLVPCSWNRANGGEAEPGFALVLDHRPFLDGCDLHGAVAAPLAQARPIRGGAKLVSIDMNRCAGEIADASRVVEVEVRRHDVAHVARAVAQIHDLPECGLRDLESWPHRQVEQVSEPVRLVDVLDAKSGVDEDQSVIALDQQAVATHRGWRQRPARASEYSAARRT